MIMAILKDDFIFNKRCLIYGSFATLPVRAWFFRNLSLDHLLPGIFRTFSTLVVSLPRCFSQLPVN